MAMRRAVILASVFAAVTAFGQARGTPASVTSVGSTPDGQLIPNGVPASVTSLGPQGFTPGINPLFPASGPLMNPLVPAPAAPVPPVHRDGHRGHTRVIPVPVYYGYPVYYSDYTDQQPQPPEPVVEKEAPPQKVEIVIVDKRSDRSAAKADCSLAENAGLKACSTEADLKAAAEPKKSTLNAPPEDPAIFIFKDGTRKELANFAVMAGNLYDLSDGKMLKIALNTIDREATLAANAKMGREIALP